MLAFDSIFKKYNAKIFNYAYFLLKCKEDAENIVQEVFIKVWENRENIRKHSSLSSYLFAIAHNTSIDLFRKKIKDKEFKNFLLSRQEPIEDPASADMEFREIENDARKAVEKLTERQRQIYLMHREEGLSYHEIADKLNISVNTVENHMVATLRILRKQLKSTSMIVILYCYFFI